MNFLNFVDNCCEELNQFIFKSYNNKVSNQKENTTNEVINPKINPISWCWVCAKAADLIDRSALYGLNKHIIISELNRMWKRIGEAYQPEIPKKFSSFDAIFYNTNPKLSSFELPVLTIQKRYIRFNHAPIIVNIQEPIFLPTPNIILILTVHDEELIEHLFFDSLANISCDNDIDGSRIYQFWVKVVYIGKIEASNVVGFTHKRLVHICDVDGATTATLILFDEQVHIAGLFKGGDYLGINMPYVDPFQTNDREIFIQYGNITMLFCLPMSEVCKNIINYEFYPKRIYIGDLPLGLNITLFGKIEEILDNSPLYLTDDQTIDRCVFKLSDDTGQVNITFIGDIASNVSEDNIGQYVVINNLNIYKKDDVNTLEVLGDSSIDTTITNPTVDGQASVDRGDHLTLLDDTNSYWWLVKVLKSEEVGYIPAENIETPYERLARMNKHKNIDVIVVENVQKSVIDDNLIADVQIKNKKVLDMEEKEENEKELVTEDENFSNIITDKSMSHTSNPEQTQLDSVSNTNQQQYTLQNNQGDNGSFDPNNISQMVSEHKTPQRKPTGIIPPVDLINPNNNNSPPLPDIFNEPSQTIKVSLTPVLDALEEYNKTMALKVQEEKKALKKEKEKPAGLFKNLLKKISSKKKDDENLKLETIPPAPYNQTNNYNNYIPDLNNPMNPIIIRIFSGQNLKSNFTFKIVLINQTTTTTSLIKQALNRFKIDNENNLDDYYITIKRIDGEETYLMPHDHPLEVFQSLNSHSTVMLPSINRSSVASVSSTFSNISNHPMVKNIESNNNEKAAAVTFYLNKKLVKNIRSSISDKKLRLHVIIYADDLPAHLRTKSSSAPIPRTSMSVPKHIAEKSARRRSREEGKPKEKHLIVNGLATVGDVILKSMEKFGIVDGIIDDGEHIESNDDEIPRYRLMLNMEGNEKLLHPKAGILSAYPTLPNLRHLSIDSLDSNSSLALDYLPDEPVFVLRLLKPEDHRNRAMPDIADPKKYMQKSSSGKQMKKSNHEQQQQQTLNSYNNNNDDDELLKRKQLIEKQREYSRAKQKSIVSAHKNAEHGVDIVTNDGSIRSSRIFGGSKVRYSFISTDGEEIDISDIIEDILGDDDDLVKLYRKSTTQDVDILVKIVDRAQNNDGDEESSQSLDKIGRVIEKVKLNPSYRLKSENQDTVGDLVYKPNKTQPFQQTKTRSRSSSNSSVNSINSSSTNDLQKKISKHHQMPSSSSSVLSISEIDLVLSNDIGLKELLILVRSGVNMLELKERRKSGWHLNEDPERVLEQIKPTEIKEEIKDVFADVNQQLDKIEQDLDELFDDVIKTIKEEVDSLKETIEEVLSIEFPVKALYDTISICSQPEDILLIHHIELTPDPPKKGQELRVQGTGYFKETVTDGSYINVVIKYGIMKIYEIRLDLCEKAPEVDENCPIEKGNHTVDKSVEIPGNVFPVSISLRAY
ncbi:20968_t:CDS:10 [Entrophospora sp. SA101]|nr:20968_t:CDS:10 [Entrophospora sp. SA101]